MFWGVLGSVCNVVALACFQKGVFGLFARVFAWGSGFDSTTPFGGIRASQGLGIGPEARFWT